ncbi:HNH endonuclease signature motif containing protein [Paenibacillus borealis]|uniref:HNH endonuclease signature motif containing protein n=1 Tax=Paenibacillus TaxID=44249 RepID=UPI0009F81700
MVPIVVNPKDCLLYGVESSFHFLRRCNCAKTHTQDQYQDKCQVCSYRIDLSEGDFYSETHHIQPRSEEGPDVFDNMIVACRNCHILLDSGSITINIKTKQVIHRDPDMCSIQCRLS